MGQLKSFKTFTESHINEIVITFGRFQPPNIGHETLFQKVVKEAQGKKYAIFASQTHDPKKNPLSYEDKIKFLRKIFPKYGRNIIEDKQIKTVLDAAVKLNKQGFTKLTLVCGSDRVKEFETLLNRYNGVHATHGTYEFADGINIVSNNQRDPDSEGAEGMSSTKMRDAAKANDLESFAKGVPRGFGEVRELFNAVRAGMGLKESYSFRKHIQLETISETREAYVQGQLFAVNDRVNIVGSDLTGTISKCGPNYIIVEASDGKSYRKWLNAVEKI